MFSCNYCSLQFNTEQELNVHTAQCYENMPGSSVDSRICEYCKTIFMTTAELTAHESACKVTFRIVMSQLESLNNSVDVLLRKDQTERPKQSKPAECSCLLKFDTVEECISYQKLALRRALASRTTLKEKIYIFIKTTWAEKKLPMIPLPPTSSATSSDVINPIDLVRYLESVWMPFPFFMPSTSQDWSKEQFSRKRSLDTDTKVDCATKISDISPKPVPSSSKIVRSSGTYKVPVADIMETDIEAQRKTFDCAFCSLHFHSLDALKTHLLQCLKIKTK